MEVIVKGKVGSRQKFGYFKLEETKYDRLMCTDQFGFSLFCKIFCKRSRNKPLVFVWFFTCTVSSWILGRVKVLSFQRIIRTKSPTQRKWSEIFGHWLQKEFILKLSVKQFPVATRAFSDIHKLASNAAAIFRSPRVRGREPAAKEIRRLHWRLSTSRLALIIGP